MTDNLTMDDISKVAKLIWPNEGVQISKTKTGKWKIWYTNDYPLQHGDGEQMILDDKVARLILKGAIPSPGDNQSLEEAAKQILDKYPHVAGTTEGLQSRVTIKKADLFAAMIEFAASRPSIDIVAELKKIAELSTYDTNHDNMLYNMKEINKLVTELLNKEK